MKMTLDELRAEAAEHGYSLSKKKPYVRLEPCPRCGGNRRSRWHIIGGHGAMFYQCNKCGFRGGNGMNERQSRLAWNEAVEEAGDAE